MGAPHRIQSHFYPIEAKCLEKIFPRPGYAYYQAQINCGKNSAFCTYCRVHAVLLNIVRVAFAFGLLQTKGASSLNRFRSTLCLKKGPSVNSL